VTGPSILLYILVANQQMHQNNHFIVMSSQTLQHVSAYQHKVAHTILTSYLHVVGYKQNDGVPSKLTPVSIVTRGPVSSVGIATGYGLGGQGSNPCGGEIFRTSPDRPWGPPSLLCTGYRVFPGGRKRPGRDADHLPLLVPRSKTE
jgi:hypothetical protein